MGKSDSSVSPSPQGQGASREAKDSSVAHPSSTLVVVWRNAPELKIGCPQPPAQPPGNMKNPRHIYHNMVPQ